jgi:hypothetical protein
MHENYSLFYSNFCCDVIMISSVLTLTMFMSRLPPFLSRFLMEFYHKFLLFGNRVKLSCGVWDRIQLVKYDNQMGWDFVVQSQRGGIMISF